MQIERLEAVGFRNLNNVDLQLSNGCIVLHGDNGHGKTNILEALYLCATGRSFRNASVREMVAHGETSGRVITQLRRQGVRHRVEIHLEHGIRRLKVDDRPQRSMGGLLQLLNVVAFFPDDLRIAKGAPEERRRFLDRATANQYGEFYDETLAYHRVLKSRNAVLRGRTSSDRSVVQIYDEQLVQHGTRLTEMRKATLEQLLPLARIQCREILGRDGELEVQLKDGVGGTGDFGSSFRERLTRAYPTDSLRGTTSVGPHRADLVFSLNGHDIRYFASQGQQRSVVLSIKLAEILSLTERLGVAPVLLLDDVSSELDAERNALLFRILEQLGGQVWISTTGSTPLPFSSRAQLFRVNSGVAQARALAPVG